MPEQAPLGEVVIPLAEEAVSVTKREVDTGRVQVALTRPCCTDQWEGRTHPYPVRGHAMRTDSGRPSSSMRLRAWTATPTSVARR